MSDTIWVRDLLLRTIIGINDDERDKPQDVVINVAMHTDARAAAVSDDIQDAVNYRTLTKQIVEHVEGSRYYLVERLAAEIADICLTDPRVLSVQVSVAKPGALRFAQSVGVTIERQRAVPAP
jgi:dihydroneopterin aldolase/D-erythro-7,8-dihydroneopterin triphosphate epimerase